MEFGFLLATFVFCIFYAAWVVLSSFHSDPVGEDDMRHLMTGIFYRDLLFDLPVESLRDYALQYYIQYPVLGVLHWPPVFHVTEAVFFAAFGFHVEIARTLLLGFVLLGGIYLGKTAGLLGACPFARFCAIVLFCTFPIIYVYGQKIMLEVPSLSLGIVSTFLFVKFLKEPKPSWVYLSSLFAVMSVLTKGGTVFLIPLFAALALCHSRTSLLRNVHLWISIIGFFAICLAYNLLVSRYNGVRGVALFGYWEPGYLKAYFSFVWANFGWMPVVGVCVSIIVALVRRNAFVGILLLITLSLPLLMVVRVSFPLDRYLINMALAVALGTALLPSLAPKRFGWASRIFLGVCTVGSGVHAIHTPVPVHFGYEPVARFLIENPSGDSVAIHASHPGNLMLHLRRLDPESDLFVLPSSKYLSYESPDEVVRMLAHSPDEAYELLDSYGVGYFVFENVEKNFKRWKVHELVSEVLSDETRFEKVDSFPIVDTARGASEVSIYRMIGDGRMKRSGFQLKMGRLSQPDLFVPLPERKESH